jgi:hypothetical protein
MWKIQKSKKNKTNMSHTTVNTLVYFLLFLKILKAGGVAQVVKHVPNKCDTLSSNPVLLKEPHSYI